MSQIDVPGGWVQLRDPKSVSERLRRPIVAKASQLAGAVNEITDNNVSETNLTSMFEFNDLVAIALIEKWSFGDVVSLEGLLDLPGKAYDEIQKIVAPMVSDLMPSFEVTPDPESPTVPSGA